MKIESKCHFCPRCDGQGCVNELPGMGGVGNNENFILNCSSWQKYYPLVEEDAPPVPLRLAPMTGAMQNVGYGEEAPFYGDLIGVALAAGLRLSIGDGYPDEKLLSGIGALRSYGVKGAVFCKPYPNHRILERFEWARDVAEYLGVDIDSYAIKTMRDLVHLEQKDVRSLRELQGAAHVPFVIKGIFKKEDIDLVRELRPDVVFISNHGGRVETVRGATVDFLAAYGKELRRYCGALWVDGGIRSYRDLQVARVLGAEEALIGRPAVTALLKQGVAGAPAVLRCLLEPLEEEVPCLEPEIYR